jgi:hypothetical protein
MKVVDVFTGEVSDSNFQTIYKGSLESQSEIPAKGNITETAYIPPQIQIADFMDAGTRLALERKARFDSIQLELQDEEDVPLDVTREPNVDIVDVQKAANAAEKRINTARKQAQDQAVEASKKAEDARIEAIVKERTAKDVQKA